mmetsp:Transcript_6507/g.23889  ORF Transcript_6507/g.23889 Transcript_6507/m.23889 type:complete len:229 (+) Transcript_6507:29-715(+)
MYKNASPSIYVSLSSPRQRVDHRPDLLPLLRRDAVVLRGGDLFQRRRHRGQMRRHLLGAHVRHLPAHERLHALLRDAHAQPAREERPRLRPRHDLADGSLVKHHPGGVVQRREVRRELLKRRHELLLELLLRGLPVLAVEFRAVLHRRARPPHRLHEILSAEFDIHDALGLEDAALALVAGVKLHLLRVDGRVDHHPRAASQLAAVRDVHKDRLVVLAKRVDDVRAVL